MARVESLGITKLESLHYYVHDLERSVGLVEDRRFHGVLPSLVRIG